MELVLNIFKLLQQHAFSPREDFHNNESKVQESLMISSVLLQKMFALCASVVTKFLPQLNVFVYNKYSFVYISKT